MGMRFMEEIFMIGMIIGGSAIAIPTVFLGVLSLFRGFPRIKISQIAGLVAVAAWVFALFTLGPMGEVQIFLFLSLVLVLLLFFGLWQREFQLLMLRRDDEFPGRLDKIGWFLMLTLAAPAGVWFFRSYRKARWPESAVSAAPKKRSSPWDEEMDVALSREPAAVE
jgi:hypothetical protein